MRGRSLVPARVDAARRLEPVHLRHLHVHEDQVVGLALHRLDRLDAVATRGRRDSPSAAGGAARASGSPRCPRRAGCAADGDARARDRASPSPVVVGLAAPPRARAGSRACRADATGAPAWRGTRRTASSSSPASRRPSELRARAAAPGACRASRLASAMPSISGMCMSRIATSNGSPAVDPRAALRPANPCRARACPTSSACSVEHAAIGRVVVDDQHALAGERRAARRRCSCERAGGTSATGASIVKQNVEPRPAPSLSPTCVPPISSASRLLIASPRPVPPYLRVVDASACENDWNSRPIASSARCRCRCRARRT